MKLRILGIRGIPAAHGGFETFAEQLSLFLTSENWQVTVYCQEQGSGRSWTDHWQRVERVHIPVSQSGPLGTIIFDWKATLHAMRSSGPCLVLGYNTAVFVAALRIHRIPTLINMDGIEWARAKWGRIAKLWFWMNDWAGSWLGGHLIADHPEIKKHLSTRVRPSKITMIPYGADPVTSAGVEPLAAWNLEAGRFLTVIARAEPENSLLEIVRGFSQRRRGIKLVVLGSYEDSHAYQRAVRAAASDEVIFTGAIYDKETLRSLRYYSFAYVHGHQVGGTNPSLVEALGAGNAVIAHDNRFNRWVAGSSARYFSDEHSFSTTIQDMIDNPAGITEMRAEATHRFITTFTWPEVLTQYQKVIQRLASKNLK